MLKGIMWDNKGMWMEIYREKKFFGRVNLPLERLITHFSNYSTIEKNKEPESLYLNLLKTHLEPGNK